MAPRRIADRVRRTIGVVAQGSGVDIQATGRENLRLQGQIHGIRGRGKLTDVEKGSAPFVIALLIMIAMICVWPDIVMIAVRWFG